MIPVKLIMNFVKLTYSPFHLKVFVSVTILRFKEFKYGKLSELLWEW